MKKFNTSPISGVDELTPELQAEFNRLKSGIARAFHLHGFQSIDTPTIERTDILLAKAGGDTEKQIYKVVKTAETADAADQALRFDHTVPLARYTVEHLQNLSFPFKAAQLGNCFRGERAQKGRFREFCQCDVDVIGWQSLPLMYDAEVISTLIDALRVLPLPRFTVRLSNRKILSGFLSELNLDHQSSAIFNIIDHAEKVPRDRTIANLQELGIGSENIDLLLKLIDIHGPSDVVIPALESFHFSNPLLIEGISELGTILSTLEASLKSNPSAAESITAAPADAAPVDANAASANSANSATSTVSAIPSIEADLLIVRGLDYYTGTVFETIAPDYREIGSICSGGRYENLASNYTEQSLPGVGGSIGLTRLFYIFRAHQLINPSQIALFDYCLLPISPAEFPAAEALAAKLRSQNFSVDINYTTKKLGDKLNYAGKVAKFAIIIGEDEVKSNQYSAKNLATGQIAELHI